MKLKNVEVRMMDYQIWAEVLLAIAYALLGIGIFWGLLYRFHWKSTWRTRRGYIFLVCIILSVLSLECGFILGQCGTNWEKAVEALSGTLQFFSLDAKYSELIVKASCAYPTSGWASAFIVLTTIYTVIVPISGLCFVGELLYSFVPRWRLFINYRKTKFVFSELNERSITLAENIARLSWQRSIFRRNRFDFTKENIDIKEAKWLSSVCIIFTDAYSDERSENRSELLMRAKRIGAICLKDDILERPIYFVNIRKRKIVYFLMDTRQSDNVASAISLLSEKRGLWAGTLFTEENEGKTCFFRRIFSKLFRTNRMEMYVFNPNETAAKLVDEAKQKYCSVDTVMVKCINEYRSVVYGMFDDEELLNSLIGTLAQSGNRNDPKKNALYRVWNRYFEDNSEPNSAHRIRIVIFGGGRIAKEYLKAAAWCFKMYSGSTQNTEELEIYVFAKDANALKGELLIETEELLKFDCEAYFYDVDFMSEQFLETFDEKLMSPESLSVQRFLVAFGDDSMNYRAANWLTKRLEKRYAAELSPAPVIIDFAVENDDLYEIFEKKYVNHDKDWCILHPFSTLAKCFSWSSIRADGLETRALRADRIHKYSDDTHVKEALPNFFQDDYKWKSSVSIALHTLYKWFCRTQNSAGEWVSLYEAMLVARDREKLDFVNQMCWLEHRRWLAYMRSLGYRSPTVREFVWMAFHDDCTYSGAHKDTNLLLHACMLESKKEYHSITDLIKEFAQAHHPDDPKLLQDIDEAIEEFNGSITQSSKAATCKKIRKILEEDVKKLKDEIAKARKAPAESDLSLWLSQIILKDNRFDALDRLSLLITLTKQDSQNDNGYSSQNDNGYSNFKDHDIEISRGLYRQVLQTQIAKLCAEIQKEKQADNADISENIRFVAEKFLNTKKGYGGDTVVSEEDDYDLVLVPDNSVSLRFKGVEEILELDKGWHLVKIPAKRSSKKSI